MGGLHQCQHPGRVLVLGSGETGKGHTDLLVLFLTSVCESSHDLKGKSLI